MSYEYADRDRDKLTINRGVGTVGAVYIHAEHGNQEISVRVEAEDAPAVALAILEAAGIDDDSEMFAASAVRNLRRVEEIRAEKVEREAEDAKVRGWLRIICQGRFIRDTYTPSELERTTYRAARDFFRESP